MRLTPIQKERLLNRDNPEFANVKRTNDYLVREALKDFLDLEDVNLILDKLPKGQLERVVTWDKIDGLLTLAERLCRFQGPGDEPYYEVPYELQSLTAENNFQPKKKPDAAKVSEADKTMAGHLKTHINRLTFEMEKYKRFYDAFVNLEKMASDGMKVPYKKKNVPNK